MNKKLAKYLSYIFGVLTIIGAVYIFTNDGNTSPGYTIIPMLITLVLQNYIRKVN